MKNNKIKLFVIPLLVFFCSIFFNPEIVDAATYTAGGTCGRDIEWYLTTDGVLTLEGKGTMDSWTWGRYPSWTPYMHDVKEVVIKSGITEVGNFAFGNPNNNGYINLKKVTLPKSVTSIGSYAFSGCRSLKTINVPSKLVNIGGYAFENCISLTKFNMPSTLKRIDAFSFYGTGLKEVTVPPSVTLLDYCAFENCDNLVKATIGSGTGAFVIGNEAFQDCDNLESIYIGSAVTCLNRHAFDSCDKLSKITIGNNVQIISGKAFADCISLKSIVIPSSVKLIRNNDNWGNGPFNGCINLKKIVFGSGLESIDTNCFANCTSLKEIYFCGDAPVFHDTATFPGAVATAYYPKGNKTWRPSVMTNQGGQIDWQEWKVPVKYSKAATPTLTNNSSSISVKWNKTPNAKGYYVFRKSGDGDWVKIATVTGSSYTDKKAVTNGRKYQYRISAYDSSSESIVSSSKTIYRLKKTNPSSVKSSSSGKLTLKWSKNDKVSGYEVRYSRNSSFSSSTTKTANKSRTTITYSGLSKGKTYYVKMRGYKTVNGKKYYSAWSDSKKVTIKK